MKKLILSTMLVALFAVSALTAQAGVFCNEIKEIGPIGVDTCEGTHVELEGFAHVVIAGTCNKNGFHGHIFINARLRGTDENGVKYEAIKNLRARLNYNADAAGNASYVLAMKLIGQGQAANLGVLVACKVRWNANGVLVIDPPECVVDECPEPEPPPAPGESPTAITTWAAIKSG